MIWMLWLCQVLFIIYLNNHGNNAFVQVSSFVVSFVPTQQQQQQQQRIQKYPFFKGLSSLQRSSASFISGGVGSTSSSRLSASSWATEEDGIYSPFAEYAWSKLEEHNLIQSSSTDETTTTTTTTTTTSYYEVDNASLPSPVKKPTPPPESDATVSSTTPSAATTTQVHIHVKSSHPPSSSDDHDDNNDDNEPKQNNNENALRYGRFALLETKNNNNENENTENKNKRGFNHDKGGNYVTSNAIHVLNLVLFPNLASSSSLLLSPPLPVLGIDLVTLPGNKHLIAIDFQPTTTPTENDTDDTDDDDDTFLPKQYQHLESKLKSIHDTYVIQKRDVIPWGGDIPPNAQRFFSPYALWTRIGGPQTTIDDSIEIIQTHIWQAFIAYFDLYLELLIQVQKDLSSSSSSSDNNQDNVDQEEVSSSSAAAVLGQKDYLNYRMENDPARPMLNRLYGKDFAEDLIETVLFPSI